MSKTQNEDREEQEHVKEFLDAFARAILSWGRVEAQLFLLFKAIVAPDSDGRVISAAYHSVLSLNTRLEMITAAAEITFNGHDFLKTWKTLRESINKNSKKRNDLAHLTVTANTSGEKIKLVLTPSIFDTREGKYREWDTNEIAAFQSSFERLADGIDDFCVKVCCASRNIGLDRQVTVSQQKAE